MLSDCEPDNQKAEALAGEGPGRVASAIRWPGFSRRTRDYPGRLLSDCGDSMAANRVDISFFRFGSLPLAELKIDICAGRFRVLFAPLFSNRRHGRQTAGRATWRAPSRNYSDRRCRERAKDCAERFRDIFAETEID